MNKLLVRIAAQAGWLFLSNKNNRTMICFWFHDIFVSILSATLTLLNTTFPADTIMERETRGTLVKFVTASQRQIVTDLDNTITAQYQKLVNALDWIRNGK